VFDGSSYVKYDSFGDYYSELEDDFSMEFYGSFSSFDNSENYINMFSNFESCGIGFQCDPYGTADGQFSGKAAANVYSYIIPDEDIPAQYMAYAG